MVRKREKITLDTFKKIEQFLIELEKPLYLTEIRNALNTDYNSLKIALREIDPKLIEKIKGDKRRLRE